MFMKYVVQRGDTLYGISKQYGVSVDELMKANNLSNTNISVGMTLTIPSNNILNYQVQKGDTLYSISKKYNISVSELMLLNNLTSNVLSIGQILNIPSGNSNGSSNFTYYEVVPGDTLYSIAKKYNTTVDSLVNLNSLKSNVLSVGQVLKVPSSSIDEKEPDSIIYIVKAGDTLYSISQKVGISVSDLMSYNNLNTTDLSVGQQLYLTPRYTNNTIPVGSSCYGESYKEPVYVTYTVKKGDNLYNIAKQYGVSVDSILKLNNLSNANLSIGQVLKIKEVS